MNSGNRLTRENTQTLIDEYKRYECLWKTTSSSYQNKAKRKEALETITRLLQACRPELKIEDVENIIKHIRLQFVAEITKLHSYRFCGETYEPTLWYFNQLRFLGPYIQMEPKPPTIQYVSTPTSPKQGELEDVIENIVIKDESSDAEIIEDSDNEDQSLPKDTRKMEENNIITISENNVISSTGAKEKRVPDVLSTGFKSTITLVPTGELIKRKSVDAAATLENDVTPEKKLKLEYLNDAEALHKIFESSGDKIGIFATFIMSQLRTVTDKVLYMKLEHKIQNAIIETQIKQIQIDELKNQ